MLRSLDELEESFQSISKKSKEECGGKLEKIRELTFLSMVFFKPYYECYKKHTKKYGAWGNYLHHALLLELLRISGHVVFLSYKGLYRNAFDNIRYALESIVQAIYIDNRHPDTPLAVKIEVLKEVEDKREYHAIRLIDELEISYKDRLKTEYKKLSRMIHSSHEHFITLWRDIKTEEQGVPTTVDCEEISRIYDSMVRMYDIFFFLIINYFPELEDSLRKDTHFVKGIRAYNLTLLTKALSIKPRRKPTR